LKKGGPGKRKQVEHLELQMKERHGKSSKSVDEEQKAVHEAYQSLSCEYHARRAYRERRVTTETMSKVEEETVVK
jgi:hypothetical protein